MNKTSTQAFMAILAPLFFGSGPLSMGEIRLGDTPARRIARESTLRGKYVEGQCLPFALALHARFQAAGIPSKVIAFSYETLPAPHQIFNERRAFPGAGEGGGATGSHAMVAYEDQGRTYLMDNQSWQPRWIHEDSPFGMARQAGGMNSLVANARVVDKSPLSNASEGKRRAAHLFPAPAPSLRQQFVAHHPRERRAFITSAHPASASASGARFSKL